MSRDGIARNGGQNVNRLRARLAVEGELKTGTGDGSFVGRTPFALGECAMRAGTAVWPLIVRMVTALTARREGSRPLVGATAGHWAVVFRCRRVMEAAADHGVAEHQKRNQRTPAVPLHKRISDQLYEFGFRLNSSPARFWGQLRLVVPEWKHLAPLQATESRKALPAPRTGRALSLSRGEPL